MPALEQKRSMCPRFPFGPLDQFHEFGFDADIHPHGVTADLVGNGLRAVAVKIRDDHVPGLLLSRERARELAPDTARAARDDDYLACDSHSSFLRPCQGAEVRRFAPSIPPAGGHGGNLNAA